MAIEHRLHPMPGDIIGRPYADTTAIAVLEAELNSEAVGGAGWRFAGIIDRAQIIVLWREKAPTGALSPEELEAGEQRRRNREERGRR